MICSRYHHGSGHKGRRLKKGLLILTAVIAGYCILLTAIHLIGRQLEPPAAEPVGSLEGRFVSDAPTLEAEGQVYTYRERMLTNVLLIGVDWQGAADARASSRYDGQADFLMLLTADRERKQVQTLQIDRDTITPIRIYGPFGDYAGARKTQICLSYAYGDSPEENCGNVSWAVSRLLGGVPIDACVVLDIGSIAALNDALGGVTVTLEDDFSTLDAQMVQGTTLKLNGQQAEYFVRGRMNVADGTNASRMQRQRTFIRAAGEILLNGMNKDIEYIDEVFDRLEGHMTMTKDRSWYLDLAYRCRDYEQLETRTLAGTHGIGQDGFMEFRVEEEALRQMLLEDFFWK